MKTQHTPGPWTVDNQYIHGPDGIRFLAVAGDGRRLAKLEAINADLLAAARLAVAWSEQVPAPYRDWPHVAAARAAIAKATATK